MIVARITFLLSLLFIIEIRDTYGQQCGAGAYAPWAYVKRKRNDGDKLAELDRSGFIDLREYTHKLLCINGIALLYNDTQPGNDDKTTIFTRSDLKLFSDQCFVFNQIKTAKAIELRNQGKQDVKLTDVSPSDIMDPRYTGVYLISERDDYYSQTAVILLQQNWDYIMTNDPYIHDGSFVTIGRGPFCLRLYPNNNPNNNEIVLQFDSSVTGSNVCRWTKSDLTDPDMIGKYGKIFNGSLTRQDLEWRDCSLGGGGGFEGGNGLGPFPIEPIISTPTPIMATTIDPFSIIMDSRLRAILAGFGNNGGKSGRTFAAESRGRSYEHGQHNNRFNGTEDDGEGGTKDPWDFSDDYIINLEARHCPIDLEPKNMTCSATEGLPPDAGCRLLKAALGIPKPAQPPPPAPAQGQNPPDKPTPTTPIPVDLWMEDILDVAASIFGKICQPFPPFIPFMISRVFKELFELITSTTYSDPALYPKRVIWDHLLAELDRCNAQARPIWWYWDNRDDYTPTDEEEEIICLIDSCSSGCEANNTDKNAVCEPNPSLVSDCLAAKIECNSASCVYDPSIASCIEDSGADLSAGYSDCASQQPTCAAEACNFNTESGACEFPTCKVSSCSPQESCKPALVDVKCEPKTPEKGAYPIDNGAGGDESEDEFGVGVIPPSLGPTATNLSLVDYPLNEVIVIREIIRPPPDYDFSGYPINVLVITNITATSSGSETKPTPPSVNFEHEGSVTGQCLFFYQDKAETNYDLNIAIDIFWKIWASVIGYCNGHYAARKGETFPRLYNTFFEDFILLIEKEWLDPQYNKLLEVILSGVNDDISQRWLDVCLESSYIVSQSAHFRPPRPVTLSKSKDLVKQPNYFDSMPDRQFSTPINLNEVEVIKCE